MNRYKATLKNKEAELLRELRNRDGIVIEQAAEEMDQVQHAVERNISVSKLNLDSALLRAVQSSLRRMEDGLYGACLYCDQTISQKRLNAIPWAAYCVGCQEANDRGEFEEAKLAQKAG